MPRAEPDGEPSVQTDRGSRSGDTSEPAWRITHGPRRSTDADHGSNSGSNSGSSAAGQPRRHQPLHSQEHPLQCPHEHPRIEQDEHPRQHADLHKRLRLCRTLRTRSPYDTAGMRTFLVAHAVSGRDEITGMRTAHAVDAPGGTAVIGIDWGEVSEGRATPGSGTYTEIPVTLDLPAASDETPAILAARRMLDLDADPDRVTAALGDDPVLGSLLARRPGLRLPRARNLEEFALGVVIGQQVSLAAARTLQGRLAARYARPSPSLRAAAPGFVGAPDVACIAAAPVDELRALGLNGARATALHAVAGALAGGLDLGPGADHERTRAALLALRGIGPWSVELIAMRALGDADAFPAGDLILRRALASRSDREARARAEHWRPFRGYAAQHLWADFLAARAAS
ncbi:MAG: DNA-3-methyladenine glycosylase 2 family protein [Leucobacter sp.]|nr:DNA-3-methyladenine glycosylase 2 family protein [Leucobacter sp.]